MAVIRCQSCGKPNPDILDTCQYCEARLTPVQGAAAEEMLIRPPANTVRCQACGRSNPNHLENCQYCEARLKPLLGSTPPAAEPASPADPLAHLRATQTFAAEPAETEADEPEPSQPANWMSRLRDVGSRTGDMDTLAPPSKAAAEPEPDWMFTQPA